MTTTDGGDPRLYFGAYHSKFLRDLASCEELTDYMSEVFQTPIAPHTMAHLGIQLNIGTKPQVEIAAWHHDSVSFTVVLSMYDPTKVDGGRFEYFHGTRDEGRRFFEEEGGELPPERTVAPLLPPGCAAMIQGSAIYHRGAPLLSDGYRASLILSFCARDASYPDGNRAFFAEEYARTGADGDRGLSRAFEAPNTMTLRRRGALGGASPNIRPPTRGTSYTESYGCDRGRRLAPPSGARRHKASLCWGLFSRRSSLRPRAGPSR
jgi:hypothetical protein